MHRIILIVLAAAPVLSACAHHEDTRILEERKPQAVEIAQKAASSELKCPDSTAQVANEKVVALRGEPSPVVGSSTLEWAEYAVNVSGCGQHATYQVTCPLQSSCYVGSPQGSGPQPR
jgi:hypothetical protein